MEWDVTLQFTQASPIQCSAQRNILLSHTGKRMPIQIMIQIGMQRQIQIPIQCSAQRSFLPTLARECPQTMHQHSYLHCALCFVALHWTGRRWYFWVHIARWALPLTNMPTNGHKRCISMLLAAYIIGSITNSSSRNFPWQSNVLLSWGELDCSLKGLSHFSGACVLSYTTAGGQCLSQFPSCFSNKWQP